METTTEPREGRTVWALVLFVVATVPLALAMALLPAALGEGWPGLRAAADWVDLAAAYAVFLGCPILLAAAAFLGVRTALERRWPGGGVPLLAPVVGLAALWWLGREAPPGAGIYLWALLVALLALEVSAGPAPPRPPRLRGEAEGPQVGR